VPILVGKAILIGTCSQNFGITTGEITSVTALNLIPVGDLPICYVRDNQGCAILGWHVGHLESGIFGKYFCEDQLNVFAKDSFVKSLADNTCRGKDLSISTVRTNEVLVYLSCDKSADDKSMYHKIASHKML